MGVSRQVNDNAMLDETDWKILRALQSNARMSNEGLAQEIGLTSAPCRKRVQTLKENGVIENYVAIFNNAAIGYPDMVIVEVTLDREDEAVVEKFEAALVEVPEIIEAYLAPGEFDYCIRMAVSGLDGYEKFLREDLYKLPGVRRARASFVLRCLKQTHSPELRLRPDSAPEQS